MKRIIFSTLTICLCSVLPNAQAQIPPALKKQISSAAAKEYTYLDKLYKYLHAHPELSFMEKNTGARIADELQKAGFAVTKNFGGYGVVGVLKNGDGPVILVRADMDGLPVKEETGLPYASTVVSKDAEGNEVSVMHACGHDVHMSVLVGTARVLAGMRDKWQGTLVFVGQPAEEKGGGAIAMLKAGLYEKFPRPHYALGLHASAALPAGSVGTREGPALANVDMLDIVIHGSGGHGAYPHTTKDPIVLAAQTIMALQTIVSRELSPMEAAVVTVGSIHGGTKHNIIPDDVTLQLTLRSYTDEAREKTVAAIRRITRGLAVAAGIPEEAHPEIIFRDTFVPVTYNDPELTRSLHAVFAAQIGAENTHTVAPVMAGEDFSQYGRQEPKIPISIFWLGTVDPQTYARAKAKGLELPSLHSSKFAPAPELTIKTGVAAMSAAAVSLLKTNK